MSIIAGINGAETVVSVASMIAAGDVTVGDDLDVAGDLTAATVQGLTWRKIAEGTTTCNTATTTTIATVTRQAGEKIKAFIFLTTDAAANYADDLAASTSLALWYQRTTNADEILVRVTNTSGTNRAVEWVVIGVK